MMKANHPATIMLPMAVAICVSFVFVEDAQAQPTSSPFTIVFVSNREHYWYPHVYWYEHDGVASGKTVRSIDAKDKFLDHQPVLTADGKLCVFGREAEADVGKLQFWETTANKSTDSGNLFATPNTVFSPSVSSDGKLLALSSWNRPGSSPRWDVLLYDLSQRQAIELPGLNSIKYDERRAALSGNGLWLAYTTNSPQGRGLTDVWFYDRQARQVLMLPELNSPSSDSYPALNADGRLVAFASDRDGGAGGLDVYLFDRVEKKFIDLPGLNSPGHEQTPSISADGRLIAFVSERFESAGEHDIFVYDRVLGRLLETPGLNTDRDDYDPCLVLGTFGTANGGP